MLSNVLFVILRFLLAGISIYSSAPISMGNMSQVVPWLCKTADDNNEHYM
jgi:hypothetical protein